MRTRYFPSLLPPFVLFSLLAVAGASAQTLVGVPHGPNDPGNCDYFDPAGCEDKAVFNTSSFDTWFGRWFYYAAQNQRLLVNVKYDSNGDGSLDAWRWPTSKVAVQFEAGATTALGTVLANAGQIYRNPANGLFYRRVMYLIYQGPFDPEAGRLCLSFSNANSDANDWTPPVAAVLSPTAPRGRACNMSNATVLAEAIGAYQRTSAVIHLFGLQGDIDILQQSLGTTKTETFFLTSTPSAPDVLSLVGMVTSNGMFTPTEPGGLHDYYFRNLDASYDPALGRVYLLRATPYPFRSPAPPGSPCQSTVPHCAIYNLQTLPMRGQLYYMNVAGDVSKTVLASSAWTLTRDIGSASGWPRLMGGVCTNYPTVMGQEDLGIDLDSLTIHKTSDGKVQKIGSNLLLTMGGWLGFSRKASCAVPGAFGGSWRDAELYEMTTPSP